LISGFSYGEKLDNANFLNKDYAVDPPMLINMIIAGRHDLSAENQIVISAFTKKMGVSDRIRFFEVPIHSQNLYAGFSGEKKPEKLSDDFPKALAKTKKSDSYNKSQKNTALILLI